MNKTATKKTRPAGVPIGPLVKSVLGLAYRANLPVLLEGHTGIGKSEIVTQLAKELNIECIVLDLSLLEPPDLIGLPVIAEGRTSYAYPKVLPLSGRGILMLEELNRAERHIQQPALQLLTARQLHEYRLPAGWVPFAAINPESDDYQVTPLDPALRSRFLNLVVRADRSFWLDWARSNGIHPAVLRLAQQHDKILEETSPRTWKYVSDVLHQLTPVELNNRRLLHAALGGYVASAWVELLLSEMDQPTTVEGFDIPILLKTFHKDTALQKRVQTLTTNGQTDVLEKLAYGVLGAIDGPGLNQLIGNKEFDLDAFEHLLLALPGDFREELSSLLGTQPIASTLLNVQAKDVLNGHYPNGAFIAQVAQWAKDPARKHRVPLLVAVICRHLEDEADPLALRNNKGAMIGLGKFREQVKPTWVKPLDEMIKRRNLQPIAPS